MKQTAFDRLKNHFDDEIRFFRTWIQEPKAMGTMVPTGPVVARKMASIIDTGSGLPVLELGPGTGSITRAILGTGLPPEKLYSVEYTESLLPELKEHHPEVKFIHGDAFDLDAALGEDRNLVFDSVISAVPMLNFPKDARKELIIDLLSRIPFGRPIVQITYGPHSPVPPSPENYSIEPFDWIVRNLPPARLWVYRKAAGN